MILRNAGALASAVRAHISGPAGMAGLLLAGGPAVLAVAACGTTQAASVALPAKGSAAAAVPAAAPSAAAATPQQVVAADYAGYWQAYGQAMTAGNAASARAILAPYAAAGVIGRLVASLHGVWAAHDEAYGAAQPHVLGVTITGTRALLHDCLDLSHFGVLDKATGRVVSGSFGLADRDYYVTLVQSGGRWLVSNMEPVEVPCQP
jgi:hypothetical protein